MVLITGEENKLVMEERQELVNLTARIWRSHHRQEAQYLCLMSLDISCELRKLCNAGHMSSLLFKKEINQIYETVRCAFSDGDLCNITGSEAILDPGNFSYEIIIGLLIEDQNELFECYSKSLNLLCEDYPKLKVCADHLDRLLDLNNLLKYEYQLAQEIDHQDTKYNIIA